MLIQTRNYDIIFDINLIAWSRVRSRFVGKCNEKKRSMPLFTAHLCITQQCLMSYCSDESSISYFTTSETVTLAPPKTKSYRVVKFEFDPFQTNPLTMPPVMYCSAHLFIYIHHFPDVLTASFVLKFAFHDKSWFSPDLVSTISLSYFAIMQLVKVSKISPIFRGRAKVIFMSFSSAESTFQTL